MTLWKCHNGHFDNGAIGHDFTAELPVCPKCGLDATTAEVSQYGLVVKRETIHLDPPHKTIVGKGSGKRPCDGKPTMGGMSTGVAAVVNCEKCKQTPEFQALAAVQGLEITVVEQADFVLSSDNIPAV